MHVHPHTAAKMDQPVLWKPERPVLTVVVDTEEEFDWDAPFDRAHKNTRSATAQNLAHEIFDPLGIKPVYVVDQAIVDCDKASSFFEDLHKKGCCEIGAHLHAWLTPPFDEEVSIKNSYQGNLPKELEYTKIKALRDSIGERFGFNPTIFKAGRYGIGRNSFDILKDLGFTIDCSVVPYTTYHYGGGANFIGLPAFPFWLDGERKLLELPLTRGYTGSIASLGGKMARVFDSPIARQFKVPAILSRSNIVKRITLTPEGVSAHDQKVLLRTLYDAGERFFSLAYHSSSLGVGHTPYVQSKGDLANFLGNLREVLTFFKQDLGGNFVTATEVYKKIKFPSPNLSGPSHE